MADVAQFMREIIMISKDRVATAEASFKIYYCSKLIKCADVAQFMREIRMILRDRAATAEVSFRI